jgi:hypothetical protein
MFRPLLTFLLTSTRSYNNSVGELRGGSSRLKAREKALYKNSQRERDAVLNGLIVVGHVGVDELSLSTRDSCQYTATSRITRNNVSVRIHTTAHPVTRSTGWIFAQLYFLLDCRRSRRARLSMSLLLILNLPLSYTYAYILCKSTCTHYKKGLDTKSIIHKGCWSCCSI